MGNKGGGPSLTWATVMDVAYHVQQSLCRGLDPGRKDRSQRGTKLKSQEGQGSCCFCVLALVGFEKSRKLPPRLLLVSVMVFSLKIFGGGEVI